MGILLYMGTRPAFHYYSLLTMMYIIQFKILMNVKETPVIAKLMHGAKIPWDGIIVLATKGTMETDIIAPVSAYILAPV